MIIAVEFDGTIVEDKYPGIGKEKPFASFILNVLNERGHKIILYTHRTGEELVAAVNWCAENGITFWAVNQNHPQDNTTLRKCNKVEADIYIDDKNLGGIPSWEEIFWMLHPDEKMNVKRRKPLKNKTIRKKLKNLLYSSHF